jgi:hypothetical protein
MNRHEQRKQKFLQDPEVAEGYLEMAAEFQLMQAIELIRSKQEADSINSDDNDDLITT